MQKSLGVYAHCQEKPAYHEADGNRRIIKDTAFDGENACSTTAEAAHVHAIQAVVTCGAMMLLVCGHDVTHHLVRGARRERCNVGSDACSRGMPGKTRNDARRD